MDAAAAKRHADFMKWTLGFWAVSRVTLVGAIAGLAQVFRQTALYPVWTRRTRRA
jgi:hypothetical protein